MRTGAEAFVDVAPLVDEGASVRGLAGYCASMYSWNRIVSQAMSSRSPMSTPEQKGHVAALAESPDSQGKGEGDDTTALANALRGGDPAAPAELFDRYGLYIHRALVRIIGSDDPESSDLLHDTFLRALQNVGRLKKPEALKSWLYGIAVFTAKEWLRARKRMGHPQPPTSGPERAAVSASPEAREAVRALYQILDTFPEDVRIAFVLRFVERMDLAAMAAICRVSLSTTRRRIKRAEARFRKALPSYPAIEERLKPQP